MPLPDTIQAYQDCLDFMDKAIEDEVGARLPFPSKEQAEHWRMRCNQARTLDRRRNKLVFVPGDKMYGCSEYDPLQFTIHEDTEGWFHVYARIMKLDPGRVELLSEVESNDNEASA